MLIHECRGIVICTVLRVTEEYYATSSDFTVDPEYPFGKEEVIDEYPNGKTRYYCNVCQEDINPEADHILYKDRSEVPEGKLYSIPCFDPNILMSGGPWPPPDASFLITSPRYIDEINRTVVSETTKH